MRDTSRLYQQISDAAPQHVVFDIFDTLIHRTVHPEDVKKLSSDRLRVALPALSLPSWQVLYQYRQELERELCAGNERDGYDLEFSFSSFGQRYFEYLAAEGYGVKEIMSKEQFVSLMTAIEISVEKTVQYTDSNVKDCITLLYKNGIPITFLSDFYLPSTIISTFLSWHGLGNSYDTLIVSADFLETKRSGKLYDRFLLETSQKPDTIMMVGDNPDVDGKMATNKGLQAIFLDRREQYKIYKHLAVSFAKIKNVPEELDNLFSKESLFPEFALSLYNFIRKLHQQLVADGVQEVFFLSREGQPLKRMFDVYQECQGFTDGILQVKTNYFLASRCATFLPGLVEIEKETFQTLFRQYRKISLKDFLCSLGLGDYVSDLAQQLKVDPDLREDDFPTGTTFLSLVQNELFREKYETNRKQQKAGFLKYLQSFEVDVSEKIFALVDVGWKGTIQDNISKILAEQQCIKGYYLGLLAGGNIGENNQKKGVLFSTLEGGASKGFFVFRENTALFEVILAADHGSASSYDGNGNGLVEDFTEDAPLYRSMIRPLLLEQEERFATICKLFSVFPIENHRLDSYVIKKHARMVYFPRKIEQDWFTSIYHRENFGLFDQSEFAVENKPGLQQRFQALQQLLMAPRSFLADTFWPALKLKEAGLGFAVYPYNAYRMFRQFVKKEI